jgi:hypothetical protein
MSTSFTGISFTNERERERKHSIEVWVIIYGQDQEQLYSMRRQQKQHPKHDQRIKKRRTKFILPDTDALISL